MTDATSLGALLAILAIYVGAVVAVYVTGVRAEIWQNRNARREFHNTYVDKVARLQGMAETDLLVGIYKSSTLKTIFSKQSQQSPGSGGLTSDERKRIDDEIKGITTGLTAVTEPRSLFTAVCDDYDEKTKALAWLSIVVAVESLAIPALAFLIVFLPLPTLLFAVLLIVILASFWGGQLIAAWGTFNTIATRIDESSARLIKTVDERIYLPPASDAEVPPQDAPTIETPAGGTATVPRAAASPAPGAAAPARPPEGTREPASMGGSMKTESYEPPP